MRNLMAKAVWVWFGFLVLAALNGLLRESLYIPQWGEFWGRVAGTCILVLAMAVVTVVFLRRQTHVLTRVRLVEIGVLWLGLSLFLEFAVLRWVMEASWEMILMPYDVAVGRLRVLVRLTELFGPILLGGRVLARLERSREGALAPTVSGAPAAMGEGAAPPVRAPAAAPESEPAP